MKQYMVTGMSCAACAARVEKAVAKAPGVTSCSVSLLTNSLGVEGTASDAEIVAAVRNAGYGAAPKGAKNSGAPADGAADALRDRETPVLKRRLAASLAFLAVLMYFSMGHMMWNWPLPAFFAGNHISRRFGHKAYIVQFLFQPFNFFVYFFHFFFQTGNFFVHINQAF